jgi:hypothetical protein
MKRERVAKMIADSKVKAKLLANAGKAGAAHIQTGEHEAVAIWKLSVLIVPDGDFWFAQGLEINYGAQGTSKADAQKNFQKGLLATIKQHIRVHGNIERLLQFAPDRVLKEAAQHKNSIKEFAQVSFHEILDDKAQKFMPFDGIDYRVLEHAA